MNTKPVYQSWTIGANLAMILGFLASNAANLPIPQEWQVLIVAVVNVILRFKTNTGIHLF